MHGIQDVGWGTACPLNEYWFYHNVSSVLLPVGKERDIVAIRLSLTTLGQ